MRRRAVPSVANARRAQLQKWLQDGSAWKKFISLVEAQDGSASVLEEIAAIYKAPITHEIRSDRAGKITAMDAEKIGRASFLLGGGRQQVDDKIDLAGAERILNKECPVSATLTEEDKASLRAFQNAVEQPRAEK